jgi:uncharacterized protein
MATFLAAGCSDGAPGEAATAGVTFSEAAQPAPLRREVVFPNGSSVGVEVVADPATRAQGLMFRPALSDDRGMLFLFPEPGRHSFWMKNTLIPLDILWIDDRRAIVHIERDVPPCRADPCPSYGPDRAASHVLELAAGQADARGLGVGDVLEYRGGIENIAAR